MGGRKWESAGFPGVRFYKHQGRRHGKQFDRYFAIRYQHNGVRHEEGVGWASQGWTPQKAALLLAELKEAARTGKGETRLAERRAKRDAAQKAAEQARVTFGEYWTRAYFPHATSTKTPKSCAREQGLFSRWINPVIGPLPLGKIAPIHLERIKKNMLDGEQAPRSVQYALAVVRQAFNHARRNGVFTGSCPVSSVKAPRVDNRRLRFLTQSEAAALLARLRVADRAAYEMALLSLHAGLRAGEILKLRWGDIDLERGLITVRDAKNGRSRFAHVTQTLREMLVEKRPGDRNALLFPLPDGTARRDVPKTFFEAVDELGFNEGCADRRDRIIAVRNSFKLNFRVQ